MDRRRDREGRGGGRQGEGRERDRERRGGGFRGGQHDAAGGEAMTEHEFRERIRERLDMIDERLDRLDERLERLERG